MFFIRWLSAAILGLAATSTVHAQSASFSVLGLASLFGQEALNEPVAGVLPWLPSSPLSVLSRTLPSLLTEDFEEAEELPIPERYYEDNALSTFVPECLKCWKEQWKLGNYAEAEMLATIACRLDPSNVMAQHALALSEIMQALSGTKSECRACAGEFVPSTPTKLVQAFLGLEADSGTVLVADSVLLSKPCETCAGAKACSKEAGCCEKTCGGAAAKTSPSCPDCAKTCTAAAKPDCCCTKPVAKKCACADKNDCCCSKPVDKACVCADKSACCCAKPTTKACACAPKATACCCEKPAAKVVASCACTKGCGCTQAKPVKKPVVFAAPCQGTGAEASTPATCPFLEELRSVWSAPMPTTASVPAPVINFVPYYAGQGMHFPPGMPMLPPGFAPPVPPGLPTPAQAIHDLECARTVAMSKVHPGRQAAEAAAQTPAQSNVHLVTPNLEAHCERLTSGRDRDHLLLEGGVNLVSNQNGQVIRIQGERVTVNLANGSFTVEATAEVRRPVPPPVVPTSYYEVPLGQVVVPPVRWQMIRPAPAGERMPEVEPGDQE